MPNIPTWTVCQSVWNTNSSFTLSMFWRSNDIIFYHFAVKKECNLRDTQYQ